MRRSAEKSAEKLHGHTTHNIQHGAYYALHTVHIFLQDCCLHATGRAVLWHAVYIYK
jgi:hypothetical protein